MPRHPPCALSCLTSHTVYSVTPYMLLLLFIYACFRSLYFFIFKNQYSASDVFSFCLISIFGFQGTTHRSNELKIRLACIFIFICICIACLHAVSKSQICECGVLATRVPDAAGEASASEVQVVYTTFSSLTLLGLSGLEPPTSRLSGVRSNRLSYKPRLPKQVHI